MKKIQLYHFSTKLLNYQYLHRKSVDLLIPNLIRPQ